MKAFFTGIVLSCLLFAKPTHYAAVVDLSYGIPRQVSLHEPVLAQVVATNRFNAPVRIDFGFDHVGELEFVVVRPDRSRATTKPSPPDGPSAVWKLDLAPGIGTTHVIVLSRWIDFSQVGQYQLTFNFKGLVETSVGQPVDIDRSATAAITVLPRNEQELKAACERLLRQALTDSNVENYQQAVSALAYTRDAVAVPFLEEAADNNRALSLAVDGLVRVGGPDARRALERLSRNPDPTVAASAKAALVRAK